MLFWGLHSQLIRLHRHCSLLVSLLIHLKISRGRKTVFLVIIKRRRLSQMLQKIEPAAVTLVCTKLQKSYSRKHIIRNNDGLTCGCVDLRPLCLRLLFLLCDKEAKTTASCSFENTNAKKIRSKLLLLRLVQIFPNHSYHIKES